MHSIGTELDQECASDLSHMQLISHLSWLLPMLALWIEINRETEQDVTVWMEAGSW